MDNRLLILKDKKLEILAHFKVRPSKKALDLFESMVDSGEFVQVVRWAHTATDKALGLKYVKEYFEGLLQDSSRNNHK